VALNGRLFISNESCDDSMKIMLEQCQNDLRFSITTLSRNFRQQIANKIYQRKNVLRGN
jgi:hypothetical protein